MFHYLTLKMIFHTTGSSRMSLFWYLLLHIRILYCVSFAMMFYMWAQSSCIWTGSWFKPQHHTVWYLVVHLQQNILCIRVFLLILFLSYQYSFFKKFCILTGIESITLHILLCWTCLGSIILHENFHRFEFFLLINSIVFIIIYQNRIYILRLHIIFLIICCTLSKWPKCSSKIVILKILWMIYKLSLIILKLL